MWISKAKTYIYRWCSIREWRSIFQSFPYSGAYAEALLTVMVFTVGLLLGLLKQ